MHPLGREVGGEVAGEDKGGFVGDEAALGGAVVEDFEHEIGIDAALGREHHALVEGHQQIAKNEVLGELGLQAHARAAAIVEAFAHGFEVGSSSFEDGLVAANHEGQGAAGGSGGGAGAGGVEKINTFGSEGLADLAAFAGADGAGIRDDGAGTGPFDDAVLAEDDLAGHVGIAEAEENEIGIFSHLARCIEGAALLFGGQCAGLIDSVGPERHFVTGAKEVAGHGVAHETESEETEFCHRKRIVAPCRSPAELQRAATVRERSSYRHSKIERSLTVAARMVSLLGRTPTGRKARGRAATVRERSPYRHSKIERSLTVAARMVSLLGRTPAGRKARGRAATVRERSPHGHSEIERSLTVAARMVSLLGRTPTGRKARGRAATVRERSPYRHSKIERSLTVAARMVSLLGRT